MDTLIIEHLACLEVNRIILQEPYHLVSEVKFNDKSPSFDGEIIVYNSNELKKENIVGSVRVQIKGTTRFKKIKANGKISHSIEKSDLEVYKKMGEGVLYLVVSINKKSKRMQTFYNALTPLDIERLLGIIERKNTDSITIDFKFLQDGYLENICRLQMKNVKKQPNHFIEQSKNREFKKYKIEYSILQNESKDFNLFDNVGYIYGIEDDIEFPLEAMVPAAINLKGEEQVIIDGEKLNIKYNITDSRNETTLSIEDTLKFEFSKDKKTGKLKLGKLISINSFLTSLKVLKYMLDNEKLPLTIYKINASINKRDKFQDIVEEIQRYEELLSICERVGLSGDYKFNENENLDILFNAIFDVFKEKKYETINSETDIEQEVVVRLKLSEYITLLLFKDNKDNVFYNIFDEDIFDKLAAFIPKNSGEFNPNTDDFYNVSIFNPYTIQDLLTLDNFNYEIYRKSFDPERHDRSLDVNNQIALDLISIYDEKEDIKYLELAENLLNGLIENNSDNSIAKLNLLQVKKRYSQQLEPCEEDFLYDLLENGDNLQMNFVANVILGLKKPAERLLNRMEVNEKSEVLKWPIYNLFLKI
ncbi:DUF4365 domain-containing protein [Ureibacillus sp. Re31]|uniref:DUF4365 domain-containing protein n=1 Tax=Ureibacillus galli TaxID=2762222 RepID=A0ABR8XAP9_9BACL|nr:DUF4365 domain-containing protein [Ureibacillus galli]MBD8026404.1 DUF4365 domain-containing protein [Ureibacillus galli]